MELALTLMLIAAGLLVAEIFIPSGGLISIGALICAIAGVVVMYQVNPTLATVMLVTLIIGVPLGFRAFLKVFPHTPVGRKIILSSQQPTLTEAAGADPSVVAGQGPKVGDTGEALTELRPVGTCKVGGERIECLAESGLIEAGTPIRVVSVSGIETKVRAV
jgi:membrane-bound ClpP family serine protease